MPYTSARFVIGACLMACALLAMPEGILAQADGRGSATPSPGAKPTKLVRDKYGSPLDTLMSTRFWTDVPPARDFVTQTRPDAKGLDYAPLTGIDPDRPKARDAANIAALQAELQSDGVKNERKARVLRPAIKRKALPSQP